MNPIQYLIELLKDPRTAIAGWITTLGAVWVYAPLFLIIFIETGVVVMPFLPGDSLLFAAGVFAADGGGLNLVPLLATVWAAAILGDQCNFAIGHFFGTRIIESGKVKSMTPERIQKTQELLDKWGPAAVFLGRFFPFIRTFVPFLSGMGGMHWAHFVPWNVLGGITWSSIFVLLGYFFGGVPFVQEHFELVLVLIIAISAIPAGIGVVKGWQAKRRNDKARAAVGAETTGGAAGAASAADASGTFGSAAASEHGESKMPSDSGEPAAPRASAGGRHFSTDAAGDERPQGARHFKER